MKILVVGRDGQVARWMRRLGGEEVTAIGRPDLDLGRPETFAPALDRHAPDIVACVGAYTAVDQAELEPDTAMRLNAEGPAALATLCARSGTPFIFVSTDYVFDGQKSAPYFETDPVAPQGAYGRSKAEGEARVAAANPRHAIVRTAWVYDAEGKNFVRTMLRLAKTRDRVGVVADQLGTPTFAAHVAKGLLDLAHAMGGGQVESGVFHMTAGGEASWADFAEAIFAGARERGGPSAAVDRIGTADYPTPARRPANSRLNCDRIAAACGVRLPPWEQGLGACLDALAAAGWPVD